jgi:predicted ATP-grasp superfamily ATP-dependent carboligase
MPSKARANLPPEMAALLIVALSGRALACSARRGGYPVLVLDLYNDLDTRGYALRSQPIPAIDGAFDGAALLRMVEELVPDDCAAVAGAGFEGATHLLEQLAAGRELCGNHPDTIARVKDPGVFFPLLDALDIPHPEVSFTAPANLEGWLAKKIGGNGGTHIRPAAQASMANTTHYYQRLAPGRSASVLFLANGSEARVIGFNEHLSTGIDGLAYWYAGAINRIELAPMIETEIGLKLDALAKATGLVGLNGLDFMVTGNAYQVLELNPRPTATIDLHDEDFPDGLFHLHLQACRGTLPTHLPESNAVRAHAVVYTRHALTIPTWFRFPGWCSDLPEAGTHFPQAGPVCTVHASGAGVNDVKRVLAQRQKMVENAILEEAA